MSSTYIHTMDYSAIKRNKLNKHKTSTHLHRITVSGKWNVTLAGFPGPKSAGLWVGRRHLHFSQRSWQPDAGDAGSSWKTVD